MSNKPNPLTPEIIIQTLKRSSLKTVLIEGVDDLQIYRNIELDLDHLDIDFLPCGGRSTLLEVYKNKDEVSTRLLFICDNDMWLFVPSKVDKDTDLITTNGYSIENELYQDGLLLLDSLFNVNEIQRKDELIRNVCLWFAYEVSKVILNNNHDCKFSDVTILNHNVIEPNKNSFTEKFLHDRNFKEPDSALFEDIHNNYTVKLRGKYIFQVLEKLFQERPRNQVRYRRDQLFDLIYRTVISGQDTKKILNSRVTQIEAFFAD